jgi:N-acetylgalactosamine-6-sulfatase
MKRILKPRLMTWAALAAASATPAAAAGPAPTNTRPNLILILADDMGYADPACFGGKAVPTPQLDALAKSGTMMTRFYAAAAVCTPTRASILTGRYPLRFDIRRHFPDDESHLPRGVVTLAGLLRAAGYATAHVGKWHLGGLHLAHAKDRVHSIPGPREHGFEHYLCQNEESPLRAKLGATRRLYRDGGTCLLRDDLPVTPDDPYYRAHFTDIIGDEAIRLVEQYHQEKRPFSLNIWHLVPHMPYEPGSEPYFSQTAAPGISDDQHRFRSMVAHMDAKIGALLAKLDQLGIRDHTLILFTSDNGGAYEADNGPFKGGKTDLHEGGIREPMIASWPGKIPTGRASAAVAGSVDMLPTFCAAAGVAVPAAAKIDGINLLPHLVAGRDISGRGPLFWQLDLYPGMQRHVPKPKPYATEAVMEGRWKLLTRDGQPLELFDLEADVGETNNLLEKHPDIVKKMAGQIRDFLSSPRDRSGMGPLPSKQPSQQKD